MLTLVKMAVMLRLKHRLAVVERAGVVRRGE